MLTRRRLLTGVVLGGVAGLSAGRALAFSVEPMTKPVAVCPICGCRIVVTADASY